MDSICIYITYECNLNCSYCFIKQREGKITFENVKKILDWFAGLGGNTKKISFAGGETLFCFDLLIDSAKYIDFLREKYPSKLFIIRHIPTNGILLTAEMARSLRGNRNLNFAFSLDGFSWLSNKYRFKDEGIYKTVLRNIYIYMRETKKIPRIYVTVHPRNSASLYNDIKSLLVKGFNDIRISPVFGLPWTSNDKINFLANFDRLLKLYGILKRTGKAISIIPIDLYINKINQGEYNLKDCPLSEEVYFNPSGEAYACEAVMHRPDKEFSGRFYLGNIDDGIDLKKLGEFKDFRICSEITLNCKYRFPELTCKRLCVIYNLRNWSRMDLKSINNIIERENLTFKKIYQFYIKNKLNLTQRSAPR